MINSKLNLDKIIKIALDELSHALKNWSKGMPKNEEALMNHITGKICRNRRRCNVGLEEEITSDTEMYVLHRRGPKQTDAFGSDLAVTISMPKIHFIKTACFQMKIGNDYKATIEKHQFEDAAAVKDIYDRCYIISIDNSWHSLRLESIKSFDGKFDGNKTISADTAGWKPISHWLIDWFNCLEGPKSNTDDPKSVEQMLEQYRIKEPEEIDWDFGDHVQRPSDKTYYPARTWTKITFEGQQNK